MCLSNIWSRYNDAECANNSCNCINEKTIVSFLRNKKCTQENNSIVDFTQVKLYMKNPNITLVSILILNGIFNWNVF